MEGAECLSVVRVFAEIPQGEQVMKARILAIILGALLTFAAAAPALADNKGPNPDPPKCTPASTPGCSGKR